MPVPIESSGFAYWFLCSDNSECPDPIEEKLRSFASLPKGWDFGEGHAPTKIVIDRAIDIYKLGKELNLDAEVFPVADGNIEVSLYTRDHFMDIFVRADGKMDFSYEVGIGQEYRKVMEIEDIDLEGVRKRLCDLPKLCGASESLEIITTRENEDLPLAVLPTTKGVFRFLIKTASRNVIQPLFVNMSRIITVVGS